MAERLPLTFSHDAAHKRFTASANEAEVAFADVDDLHSGSFLIKHTEVLPGNEGGGVGSGLIKHVLDEARAQGKTVIPLCPFASAYIKRHREYVELVRPDYRAAFDKS